MDRRDFLKVTGAQAGALLAAPKLASAAVPGVYEKAPDVVVVDLALGDCVEAIRAIVGQGRRRSRRWCRRIRSGG